ncbi:MAG: AhpC/TSA family protein [Gammaproteobacteria bacterium]|nr:AhpC/TSA family protein [Gammaproteobacteria bacterium]
MHLGQKLVYTVFLSLFVGALACTQSAPVVAADGRGIAPSAEEIDPVKTGEAAPSFTVRTVDDEPFVFDPANLERPVVLITFRGGWCPYCNMHLSELRNVVPDLAARGVDVYFLSGDRPELLYSSLKRETQADIEGLGYTILSDAGIDAAKALGIAFMADPDYVARRDDQGDIDGSSMKNFGVLPVPAVYVIDRSGMVTYSFVEADYKVRLPADDLLEALGTLAD